MVVYESYISENGWKGAVKNSETRGTEKSVESIRIKLYGEILEHHDVYYRVHSQDNGWLDWSKNGQRAGTERLSRRLEVIEIQLFEKDSEAASSKK